MTGRNGLLSALMAVALAAGIPLAGLAQTVDILRSVPLEISGYESTKTFPSRFSAAAEVLDALNANDNVLVRMEVIRRAHAELSAEEQDKLLTTLHSRHRAEHNNVHKFFDHGYAQLVLKNNKSGLFFLRKANDRLENQFTALAYAMAQAEVDVNEEGQSPDVMTDRKLDVIFKMKDAIQRDATAHQPGFWPSYIRVVQKLAPMKAYEHFARNDFSLYYLPYGNTVTPLRGASTAYIPLKASPDTLLSNALNTACDPTGTEAGDDGAVTGNPVASRAASFNGQGATIQFFNTEEAGKYRVRVLDPTGFPMLSFTTYTRNNVVEDLDKDGTFEIVVRQYDKQPLQPVIVYRATPCGFELDRQIRSYFQ